MAALDDLEPAEQRRIAACLAAVRGPRGRDSDAMALAAWAAASRDSRAAAGFELRRMAAWHAAVAAGAPPGTSIWSS